MSASTPKKKKVTPPDQHVGKKDQATVLNIIVEHVGLPCPTNGEISVLSGLKKETVANAVSALASVKTIRRIGSRGGRIIKIEATGHCTLPGLTRARRDRERGGARSVMPVWGKEGEEGSNLPLYRDISLSLVAIGTGGRVWRQA